MFLLKEMNTQRNDTRNLEEEIANAVVSPHGYEVPPLEEYVNDDQALVNPPPFTDDNIWATLFKMSLDITTQAQTSTNQAQAMTT